MASALDSGHYGAAYGASDEFARILAPVVAAIQAEGHYTLRAVAEEPNAGGMLTRRGGRWQVSNLLNLLARPERLQGRASCRASTEPRLVSVS